MPFGGCRTEIVNKSDNPSCDSLPACKVGNLINRNDWLNRFSRNNSGQVTDFSFF